MILRFLNNLPLRAKFIFPTWVLMTFGLIVLGSAVDHAVVRYLEKSLIDSSKVMAMSAASNLNAAVAFGDVETGREQLHALSADPDLIAARVMTNENWEFASFSRLPDDCYRQGQQILCVNTAVERVSAEIVLGDDKLGEIFLIVSRDNIEEERRALLMYLAAGTAALSILSLVFAQMLHRIVASPLASLHQSMSAIIRLGVVNRSIPVRHNDELGQVTACFNEMVTNLSERDGQLKQTLQELENKSRYISQVMDTMDQGVMVVAPGDNVTYYNPAAEKQLRRFGCAPTDLESLLDVLEPAENMIAISNAIDAHLPLKNVELSHPKTGQVFLISTDPMATAHHSLLQFEDVTAHRESEQRRKFAEMIFDKSQNATLVLSRSLKIKTQNTASIRLFGENRTWEELDVDHRFRATFSEIKALISAGSYQWRGTLMSEAGDDLPCQITAQTLVNHRGKIDGYVVSIVDQTVEMEIKRLNHIANHDLLTGLPNRAHAFDKLSRDHEKGHSMHVLFIDLDGFKAVNDQFGHNIGDELLKVVASRMKSCLPRSDFVARLSGDEFLIAIQDTSSVDSIVKRLLERLSQEMVINQCKPKVSASIGIRRWAENDNTSLATVIEQADKAMYGAKANGKNGFALAKEGSLASQGSLANQDSLANQGSLEAFTEE
ncbi:diguanylate cyclase domain-containing protein [Enterovibrio calviensis]|uniref:diguanylate cyclase domain-containing protein n=1 Tax=Enterovibrio calviensis TaxID=91359 RepID=UPI0009DCF140|nr:diguanylate cyclase [Enterovibrio calviensis]